MKKKTTFRLLCFAGLALVTLLGFGYLVSRPLSLRSHPTAIKAGISYDQALQLGFVPTAIARDIAIADTPLGKELSIERYRVQQTQSEQHFPCIAIMAVDEFCKAYILHHAADAKQYNIQSSSVYELSRFNENRIVLLFVDSGGVVSKCEEVRPRVLRLLADIGS